MLHPQLLTILVLFLNRLSLPILELEKARKKTLLVESLLKMECFSLTRTSLFGTVKSLYTLKYAHLMMTSLRLPPLMDFKVPLLSLLTQLITLLLTSLTVTTSLISNWLLKLVEILTSVLMEQTLKCALTLMTVLTPFLEKRTLVFTLSLKILEKLITCLLPQLNILRSVVILILALLPVTLVGKEIWLLFIIWHQFKHLL